MAPSDRIPPKGPTRYDLLNMGDEEFESMVARLVRLEFPKAFKPANTRDGGADMVLLRSGRDYERCWQSKHFPRRIRWDQCEKSLAAALEAWPGISEYTFVFPRDLTSTEQKTFDMKFRGPNAVVEVNYWNGEELQSRLTGSDAGQRVARSFFGDAELDQERLQRAIESGGRLQTAEDALDRLGNVGGFLASNDPFFSYPTATHEADQPGPPLTPGSVMSVGETEGAVTRRIDLVPRDEEAMERYGPEFVLDAAEGEAGRRAAEKLAEALREGKAVEIGEGLDVTFTRLPPAFEDMVGKRMSGEVRLGEPKRVRRRVPPFRARLLAETDRGKASVDIELRQLEEVPHGWDVAFVGEYGGMTVTQFARRVGDRGEVHWNLRHERTKAPVREQLAALKFLTAFAGAGEFELSRIGMEGAGLRAPTEPVPVSPETDALVAFLEDVRAIEEWAEVEYELPETISAEDARGARQIAAIIRGGGVSITWHNMEFVVDEAGVQPLRDNRVLRVERRAAASLFGRVVELGYTRVDLDGYKVESVKEAAEDAGKYVVRLEPSNEQAAKAFERLSKNATSARPASRGNPPPPPPRKRRKKSSGRNKKRGR